MSERGSGGFDPSQQHLRPDKPTVERSPVRTRERSESEGLAWLRREELGFLPALAVSVWRLASRPAAAFAALPARGGMGSAWLFAVACWMSLDTASELMDALTTALLPLEPRAGVGELFQLTLGGRSLDWLPLSLVSITGCLVALLVAPPAMLLAASVLLPVWSAVLHACLALAGCLRRSRAGFEGTFRAVCFGQAGLLGGPLPLVGDLLSLIWSLVLQSFGVARIHGCSRRRAAVAVTAPWLVLLAAITLLVLLEPAAESALPAAGQAPAT